MSPSPLKEALSAAPDAPVAAGARPEREYFCFRIGELSMGVPSENVREVIRPGPLTALPRAAPFLIGVTGHRGEVLPVIDLLRFLGKGESRVGPRSRLFVGLAENFSAALVTDAVAGLRKVARQDILPAPMGGDAGAEHVLGVVHRKGEPSLTLLNLAKLLGSARQRAVVR
ncbi:MAG: chemotaxis protein CheW [Myxococcales bacterium]|nr:chemotaxis protein CheW [Myxococcales bacterium]